MPTLDDLVVCDTIMMGHAYFNLTQQNPIILWQIRLHLYKYVITLPLLMPAMEQLLL
jgi:hypothetical protein